MMSSRQNAPLSLPPSPPPLPPPPSLSRLNAQTRRQPFFCMSTLVFVTRRIVALVYPFNSCTKTRVHATCVRISEPQPTKVAADVDAKGGERVAKLANRRMALFRRARAGGSQSRTQTAALQSALCRALSNLHMSARILDSRARARKF